jgi:hypothetical protein
LFVWPVVIGSYPEVSRRLGLIWLALLRNVLSSRETLENWWSGYRIQRFCCVTRRVDWYSAEGIGLRR